MQKLIHANHNIVLYIIVIYILLGLFACTPAPPPIAPPTSTPNPTSTNMPTATITPSATLLPPSATPTPLAQDVGQVIFSESFDDMDFPLGICGAAHIESGVLVVERDPQDTANLCGMFSGGIYGQSPIPPDTFLVVLFKTTSDFNMGIHTGDYGDETLRRFSFGITQGIATWDMAKGQHVTTWRTRATRADSWYYFSIKLSANGDVSAKLWERDKPDNVTEFQGNLGPEWGTLPLTFVSDFKDVPFFLDEYQVLK